MLWKVILAAFVLAIAIVVLTPPMLWDCLFHRSRFCMWDSDPQV